MLALKYYTIKYQIQMLYYPGYKQIGAAIGSADGGTEAGGRVHARIVNPNGVWLCPVPPQTNGAAPRRALKSPRVVGRRVTASRMNRSAKAESTTKGAGARCASAVSLVCSLYPSPSTCLSIYRSICPSRRHRPHFQSLHG